MVNRWLLELTGASIGDCRVLCFLSKLGLPGILLPFSGKSSRYFRETKSQPAVDTRARLPVDKEPETPSTESAVKKRQSVSDHRPHERKACATRAKAGGEASLEFGGEREPHGTCQRAGTIIGPVDSARRRARVR